MGKKVCVILKRQHGVSRNLNTNIFELGGRGVERRSAIDANAR